MLATASTELKDAALRRLAELLGERADEVLEANAADLADERAAGLDAALLDRLTLDAERVAAMAAGVREIVALPDPVGEVIEQRTLASGLELRKVRVPLGVVAVVYEARPNVTVDCAALCLKSGNAIVLRGLELRGALERGARRRSCARRSPTRGCPRARSSCVDGRRARRARPSWRPRRTRRPDHSARRRGAEGGAQGGRHRAGDVRRVGQLPRLRPRRRRPRDGAADRLQRQGPAPGVCNAAETLLVNAAVAERFLPGAARRPPRAPASSWSATSGRAPRPATPRSARRPTRTGTPSTSGMKMAVGVVDSLDEAIEHVNRHGSGHSEAIVTVVGGGRATRSPPASTPRRSTSTPRPASPTASSSGWARRSATRPRSFTRAGRSACAS